MAFVNRSGDAGRADRVSGAAPVGGLPGAVGGVPDAFDPDDPDVVKVFYDVEAWGVDQRAELSAALAEHGLVHAWVEHEVVVPEIIEARVDAVIEELEERLGPFPVLLDAEVPAVGFQVDDFDADQREVLDSVLIEARIAHRFHEGLLAVAEADADQVDELLDAIERGELSSSIDEDDVAPDVLGRIFSLADRLGRDETDGAARRVLFELTDQLSATSPPFGLAQRSWAMIIDAMQSLRTAFDAGGFDTEAITSSAEELKSLVRPYV
jgi:hypothetical protein